MKTGVVARGKPQIGFVVDKYQSGIIVIAPSLRFGTTQASDGGPDAVRRQQRRQSWMCCRLWLNFTVCPFGDALKALIAGTVVADNGAKTDTLTGEKCGQAGNRILSAIPVENDDIGGACVWFSLHARLLLSPLSGALGLRVLQQ